MTITSTTPGPPPFSASIVVSADHPRDRLGDDVQASIAALGPRTGPLQVWVQDVAPGDDARLVPTGLLPYRDLLQLRCTLPAAPSGIVTRAFDPLADVDMFVAVNNRAFAWHPEQGGLTADAVAARMAEPWFDADGFRILELEGRMAGFCWTKIHPPTGTDPALGEIYVIAVDPDFHGRGLGAPMTLAGLEWLSSAGLAVGMLYVESDNAPALATYRRIGFAPHATDRAYRDDR